MDREAAEEHAENIWRECATTGAIADYLQSKFSTPSTELSPLDESEVFKVLSKSVPTLCWIMSNSQAVAGELTRLSEIICSKFGTPSVDRKEPK